MKKTAISTTLAIAMGLGIAGQAAAATLTAGSYTMTIRETPELCAWLWHSRFWVHGRHSSAQLLLHIWWISFVVTSLTVDDNGHTVGGVGGIGVTGLPALSVSTLMPQAT